MRYYLIVVEGAQDAAFVARLLRELKFKPVDKLTEVDPIWKILIPTSFPARKDLTLNHVVKYPDIHLCASRAQSVAVVVAGSDSALVEELQVTLEVVESNRLSGIAIFCDADDKDPPSVLEKITEKLTKLNHDARDNGLSGFPLVVPAKLGALSSGMPPLGVFVVPDNDSQGTLETVLLECAKLALPHVSPLADTCVENANAAIPTDHAAFKNLRKGSGQQKAKAGIVAQLLAPGASLAVAIGNPAWFSDESSGVPSLTEARRFIGQVLA